MFCFGITILLDVLSCYAQCCNILLLSSHVKINSELIESEISKDFDKSRAKGAKQSLFFRDSDSRSFPLGF